MQCFVGSNPIPPINLSPPLPPLSRIFSLLFPLYSNNYDAKMLLCKFAILLIPPHAPFSPPPSYSLNLQEYGQTGRCGVCVGILGAPHARPRGRRFDLMTATIVNFPLSAFRREILLSRFLVFKKCTSRFAPLLCMAVFSYHKILSCLIRYFINNVHISSRALLRSEPECDNLESQLTVLATRQLTII